MGWFSNITHAVSHAAGGIIHKASSSITGIVGKVAHIPIIEKITKFGSKVAHEGGDLLQKTKDSIVGVEQGLSGLVQGIGGSSTLIILVGGAVAAAFVMSQR